MSSLHGGLAVLTPLGQNQGSKERTMDFPWYEPKTNDSVKAANPSWRADMHRREIQMRAALLYRLGRSVEEATAAIRRYVRWEFDGLVSPKVEGEIGALVEAVYKRQKPAER